jgi:hypothetical protein
MGRGDRLFVLLGNLKAYQATVAEIRIEEYLGR